MEKVLSKIFYDVYCDYFHLNSENDVSRVDIKNYQQLEEELCDYVRSFLGYKINFDYTLYYREIKKYFQNAIVNSKSRNFKEIIIFLEEYSKNFFSNIEKTPYSAIFIDTVKKMYSNDYSRYVIEQVGESYKIGRINRKEEDEIPNICIRNITQLDITLQKFVEDVLKTDTYFNSFFDSMSKEQAISYLFEWVVRNATTSDMLDIERYFQKYDSFITDDTLSELRVPIKASRILGYDLYIYLKKANVNYETPYYLSFIFQNEIGYVELPNIRLGIEKQGNIRVANILATQTSQSNYNTRMCEDINNISKKMLGKSKFFREFNPMHVFSIILAFGLLKGVGISNVSIVDYFPLRYQRLVLEGQKSECELNNLQYRLTNKNIYTYLRTLEYFSGIQVLDYVGLDGNLIIKLGDIIQSSNEFLQKLYNIGCDVGMQIDADRKIKQLSYNAFK